MSHRVLEIIAPPKAAPDIDSALADASLVKVWKSLETPELVVWRALAPLDAVEPMLDKLENRCGLVAGFRVLVEPIDAIIPTEESSPSGAEPRTSKNRISRPELYEDIASDADPSVRFFALVILAVVVVIIGLVRDSGVIVLAGMVIAPLLGPNMALALGTTLGDTKLMKRSFVTSSAGFASAFILAVAYAAAVRPDLSSAEVMFRTGFVVSDLVLALAAGVAGTLAYTTGTQASLIGVMVAVALLPPTVVAGMTIGRGAWPQAGNAVLLLGSNVLCVHLAAVGTFVVQGIKPSRWWDEERARRATRMSMVISVTLLIGLIVLLVVRSLVQNQ